MAAADGQTFEQQPQQVRDAFLATWGGDYATAAGQWELQHNIEIGQGPTSYGHDGTQRQVTGPLSQQVGAPQPHAPRPGQGAPVPPVFGAPRAPVPPSPTAQRTAGGGWYEPPAGVLTDRSQMRVGGVYRNVHNGFPYLWDGTSFRAIRHGQVDSGGPGQLARVDGDFSIGLGPEHIGPDLLDTDQAVVSAVGGSGGSGSGGSGVNAMSPQMLSALNGQMSAAANAAQQYSTLTGIVHEPVFDPATGRWTYQAVKGPDGQPMKTMDAQKFGYDIEKNAADRAYNQLLNAGFVVDPSTGQRLETLALKTFEEGRRQFDATHGLARENQAFEQQRIQAQLAANPRNYVEASMLRNARGGLGGMAPNNQASPTTIPQFGPDGTPLTFSQTPPPNANMIPVSAGTNALLQNAPIPQFGSHNVDGGYINPNLLSTLNLNKLKAQDYMNLRPSEQQQTLAVTSLAGYNDSDTLDALKRNLPQFRPANLGSLTS